MRYNSRRNYSSLLLINSFFNEHACFENFSTGFGLSYFLFLFLCSDVSGNNLTGNVNNWQGMSTLQRLVIQPGNPGLCLSGNQPSFDLCSAADLSCLLYVRELSFFLSSFLCLVLALSWIDD